jgi:mono/diheme cytochrome c family protein
MMMMRRRDAMGQSVRRLVAVTASAGLIVMAGVSAHTAAQGTGSTAAGGEAASKAGPAAKAPAGSKSGGSVARGEYLVNAMGCHDCHTPAKMGANGPEPDMSHSLGGHPSSLAVPPPPDATGPWIGSVTGTFTAWSGPWGVSYTANLTPDKATGLGEWTEQQFVDTIRTGRRQGRGREILPPMPWPAFKNLNDADLKAIFAYLRTVKPIVNKVPEPVLATAAVSK